MVHYQSFLVKCFLFFLGYDELKMNLFNLL